MEFASRRSWRGRWPPRFAVLGAGNGGQAMAGHLAAQGRDVILFNRSRERLEALERAGRLRLTGALEAVVEAVPWGTLPRHGRPAGTVFLTDRVERAAQAEVLMVTVPATAHGELGRLLAPHVREDQLVVLNPGRTLGALEMESALLAGGCRFLPLIAEAQSLLYAARLEDPGRVQVFSVKKHVPLAALPAWRTPAALARLQRAFPQFVAAESVLHTGLDNVGAVFHPAPVLLNLARVEAGEVFDHYHQGITPAVARVLEALDAERLEVARALGVDLPPVREWLARVYGAQGEDLYRALQGNGAYRGIKAPTGTDTRYLWEDVPTGLVPLASLGEMAWVPTPTIRSLIHLASLAHGVDYFRRGRTLESLGLGGMDLDQLREYVLGGREAA